MTDLKKLKAAADAVRENDESTRGLYYATRSLLDLVDALPADAVLVPRAELERVREACAGLLRFNEDLCADVGVSKHYPSAEKGRVALATLDGLLKEPT